MLSFHLAFRSYAGSICIFCSAQHWKQPYTRLQISVNIISYSADVLKFTYLSILSMLILGNFFYFCWSSWISVFCGKCSGYSLLCLEKSKVSFFIQTSEWLLPFFSKHLVFDYEISPYGLKIFSHMLHLSFTSCILSHP